MARSDLLLNLVQAGADRGRFEKIVNEIIADERAKNHNILADRLQASLAAQHNLKVAQFAQEPDRQLKELFLERNPRVGLEDLVLPDIVRESCKELVEEQFRKDVLQAHNLRPRHKLLLAGPPGNGKTSLAEAIAYEIGIPLLTVRYEGIVGSYLGETATRLKALFDFVKTRQCVLFFDEFETLGKERGDEHESGEIKRLVSSLLLQLDDLPSYVIAIAASNHHKLLDSAVWRRFDLKLALPKPSGEQCEDWLKRFEQQQKITLGKSIKGIIQEIQFGNFAELQQFCMDIRRKYSLTYEQSKTSEIVSKVIQQWKDRSQMLQAGDIQWTESPS